MVVSVIAALLSADRQVMRQSSADMTGKREIIGSTCSVASSSPIMTIIIQKEGEKKLKKKSVLFGAVLLALVLGMFSCSNLIEDLRGHPAPPVQELEPEVDLSGGFGMWPQTIKAADVNVDETESKVVGMFTYYKGSDGAWYAKCTENAYGSNYTYSDGTTVAQASANSYKYFKVEPIKWIVLTDDYGGKKLFHSEKILMGLRYDDDSNNYKNSEIRSWLNGDFYNTAFTSSERNRISDTNVDNSARSTNPDSNPHQWNSGTNTYACENTTDRIFLLSEQEVTKSEYGFAEYNVYKGDSNGTTESTRIRMTTDFAKASGAYQNTTAGCGGWWWRRSPDDTDGYYARVVLDDGHAGYSHGVDDTNGGVCPALSLK